MLITTRQNFENVKILNEVKVITSCASYGTGFLTLISKSFCNLFGCRCKMYENKLELAKKQALNILIGKARNLHANAIVDLKIIHNFLNVYVTGLCVIVEEPVETNKE